MSSIALLNSFYERMTDTLANHDWNFSIGGRIIVNIRFAKEISGITLVKNELKVDRLDRTI